LGFLKFLKRNKDIGLDLNLDKLDVLPEPPKFDKTEKFHDISIPDIEDYSDIESNSELNIPIPPINKDIQNIRSFNDISMEPIPKMPKNSEKKDQNFKERILPEIETTNNMKEMHSSLNPKPVSDKKSHFQKESDKEGEYNLQQKRESGPIYVTIDKFRNVLSNISSIRGSLKGSGDMLTKMEDIDINSDKEFEKWKSAISEIQMKLIYIDKTLFKR